MNEDMLTPSVSVSVDTSIDAWKLISNPFSRVMASVTLSECYNCESMISILSTSKLIIPDKNFNVP